MDNPDLRDHIVDEGRRLGYSTQAMRGRTGNGDAMTMYLPNTDIRPTGYEPAEFIEPPTISPAADPDPGPAEVAGAHDEDDVADEMRAPRPKECRS